MLGSKERAGFRTHPLSTPIMQKRKNIRTFTRHRQKQRPPVSTDGPPKLPVSLNSVRF
jgi:hypothetical protein